MSARSSRYLSVAAAPAPSATPLPLRQVARAARLQKQLAAPLGSARASCAQRALPLRLPCVPLWSCLLRFQLLGVVVSRQATCARCQQCIPGRGQHAQAGPLQLLVVGVACPTLGRAVPVAGGSWFVQRFSSAATHLAYQACRTMTPPPLWHIVLWRPWLSRPWPQVAPVAFLFLQVVVARR